MAKVVVQNRVYTHETKPHPKIDAPTKIVEAFGLGKCAKLVAQVRSERLDVRVNALEVLCAEFSNPASIAGCIKAGIMSTLPDLVLDTDLQTRMHSSRALVSAARDYNGRTAMLVSQILHQPFGMYFRVEADAPRTLFKALDDESVAVRNNVYHLLVSVSVVAPGVRALVEALYPAKLVEKVGSEVKTLKPMPLKVLYNVMKARDGLQAALDSSAVETCINLLSEEGGEDTQREAAITLGLACYDDTAKIIAIQNDGVAHLAALLESSTCRVKSAALGALMTITTVDAGKRAVLSTKVAEGAIKALGEKDHVVVLNALKLIASIAAHPDTRAEFRDDDSCLGAIQMLEASSDSMIAKHASIAREAVLWVP